ncbi:MAG TPA: sugar phosphate isomerase/epimerase [Paenirhodobacter sp.]
MTQPKFAVDLITFYPPDFWGVATSSDIDALAERDLHAFWEKMLTAAVASGVRGIETSIGPLGHQAALRAYGSAQAVRARFNELGLQLVSCFYHGFERFGDPADAAVRQAVCDDVRGMAEFLNVMGGEVIVLGLPMRRTKGKAPVQFVDLARAQPLAQLCNELGASIAEFGLRLALHTEGHSVMCTARDVDLFMLLTDPLYVGFCPDSAHLLLCGADPVEVLNRHKERLVITHWKDAISAMPLDVEIGPEIHTAHRAYFCKLGAGRVHWQGWAQGHADAGFTGWMVLEVDGSQDPVAVIRDSRTYVETAVAHLLR